MERVRLRARLSSLDFTYAQAGATFKVRDSDLGRSAALNFVAVALSVVGIAADVSADFGKAQSDVAPDRGHGTFHYTVLTTLKRHPSGSRRADRRRTRGVARSDRERHRRPGRAGTVSCAARFGGKIAAVRTHRLANGVASCVWQRPSSASGKTLRGTVTLVERGVTLAKSFAAQIR